MNTGSVRTYIARPVLKAPCEECGMSDWHSEMCDGEPRQTLAQVLARAQGLADEQLRERVKRFLSVPQPRQGALPRGKYCDHCRDSARYPDLRCAEHTAYLPEGGPAARAADSDGVTHIAIWREFFGRLDRILKT
jgi:hypothetical protein